ncbi:hypothetical protein CP556_05510 [Natrinema sp. CBA1119]|uniref:hypothetical protein n=1 Tax=Natrinema sp. CBA1119 TaxID=1608465 RepID=UPI000BF45E1D|nr:hypothetical protein [Natrinema sp. CBA1119]PGF15630.1 hypothetical protein CP556_05510 [Natrinema sp. CBA1119]
MRPGTKTGSSDSRQEYKDQVKPDLLDFLFTLALTIGIAPELVGGSGLLSHNWALGFPNLAFLTHLGTFLLGVSTLLFSWYGFNASISNNPVLYGSVAGMFRFFLDAFLVVIYGFMLIMYEELKIVTALLVLIFFLYSVWDLLKLMEYRREPFDKEGDQSQDDGLLKRFGSFGLSITWKLFERGSLLYLLPLVFVSLIEFSGFFESHGLWKDAAVIIALFVISITYRINKVEWTFYGDEEKIARVNGTD